MSLLLLLVALIVLVCIFFCSSNLSMHLSYALLGRTVFTSDWSFQKGPLVHIIDDKKAVIIWEACSSLKNANLTWNNKLIIVKPNQFFVAEKGVNCQIFHGIVDDLQSGQNDYSINYDGKHELNGSVQIPLLNSTKLRVAVLGDSQLGVQTFRKLLPMILKNQPEIFLHLGDMVQTASKDFDWQAYFFDSLAQSGLLYRIPFLITQGNHDVSGREISPYFPHLNRTGYYYATTIGPARFYVLDANCEDDAQVIWLQNELSEKSSKTTTFKIVLVHIPPFLEYWDPETWRKGEYRWPIYVRTRMVPLFEKYKVDLVLSGHQHNYQRGEKNGVNYIISGGGGGSLETKQVEDFNMYKVTLLKHHFLIMDITESQVNLKMWKQDGELGDEVTIFKSISQTYIKKSTDFCPPPSSILENSNGLQDELISSELYRTPIMETNSPVYYRNGFQTPSTVGKFESNIPSSHHKLPTSSSVIDFPVVPKLKRPKIQRL